MHTGECCCPSSGERARHTDLAQGLPQHPTIHQRVDDGDGQTNDAHKDVGARQVGDQDVGDVAQLLLPGNDEHQTCIA